MAVAVSDINPPIGGCAALACSYTPPGKPVPAADAPLPGAPTTLPTRVVIVVTSISCVLVLREEASEMLDVENDETHRLRLAMWDLMSSCASCTTTAN